MVTSFITYLREAVQELELVRWPTRQQAVRLSVIVLIFTIVNSAVFGLIDMGLSQVVYLLTQTI